MLSYTWTTAILCWLHVKRGHYNIRASALPQLSVHPQPTVIWCFNHSILKRENEIYLYLVGSSAKEKSPVTLTTFFLFSKPP